MKTYLTTPPLIYTSYVGSIIKVNGQCYEYIPQNNTDISAPNCGSIENTNGVMSATNIQILDSLTNDQLAIVCGNEIPENNIMIYRNCNDSSDVVYLFSDGNVYSEYIRHLTTNKVYGRRYLEEAGLLTAPSIDGIAQWGNPSEYINTIYSSCLNPDELASEYSKSLFTEYTAMNPDAELKADTTTEYNRIYFIQKTIDVANPWLKEYSDDPRYEFISDGTTTYQRTGINIPYKILPLFHIIMGSSSFNFSIL